MSASTEAEILAGDLLHAGQGLGAGVVVVVGHDDIIPGGQKFHAGVAADVTGATAYQNCHNDRLLITYVSGQFRIIVAPLRRLRRTICGAKMLGNTQSITCAFA